MIRSESQARAELGPHEGRFYRVVHCAIDEFLEKQNERRADYSKRSVSSVLNDYMVNQSKREFDGVPEVKQFPGKQSYLLGIGLHWIVKFKKLGDGFRYFNILTQRVLDFGNQNMEIEGFEEPTSLIVGYQLIGPELRDAKVWLVCPNGNRLAWPGWELRDQEEGGLIVPFPSSAPPTAPVRQPPRPREVPEQTPAADAADETDKPRE